MGQSPLGAGFTTASAGSARNAGTSSDPFASHTPTTPGSSGVSVYPAPPLPTTTSRAVTGAPSQNCASARSVNAQRRPPSLDVHDSASAGTGRPSQSNRTSVSYRCRNTSRSASLRGTGAWVGSTESVRATVMTGARTPAPRGGASRQSDPPRADASGAWDGWAQAPAPRPTTTTARPSAPR